MDKTTYSASTARRLALRKLTVSIVCMLSASIGLVPTGATAQESAGQYPSKPIQLIIPFAAGGGTDIQGRIVAQEISKILGQPVVVENRAGAGGGIGAKYVAGAAPDGYTLLVGSTGTHTANEFLYSKLPYDSVKDFTPITLLATFDNAVFVPSASPIRTLKDLIDAAKKNPGKLNYGVTTVGSSSHLAVEKLRRDAGIDAVPVPYNGAGQAMVDLLGGRLDFILDLVGTQSGNLEAGKVRALASTALTRNPVLKNVPTVAESGYPGFSAVGWIGLFAPAGTPPAAVEKIYFAVNKAFQSPELQASMRARGFDIAAVEPKEFTKFLAEERAKWSTVIREAHIKLD